MSRRSMGPAWLTGVEAAVAVPAALAIHRFWPLDAADPFRTSLAILPLAVVALRALERHAPRPRQRDGGFAGRLEAAALALLVVLTVGRQSLGLATTDAFIAGGYFLLLAHRTARLLLLWRPALGNSVKPAHPAYFFLPLVVYLALQPWQAEHRQVDGDEPFYLLLTHSLVHDLDVELGGNYARQDWRAFMDRPIEPQPGDPLGANGEVYSRHNVLLPLLLSPGYLIGGRWGAMVTMALFAAALAWTVLALARLEAGRSSGAALWVYAVFAFSPPLLLYSYQIWIEVPAALIVAAAYYLIRTFDRHVALTPRQIALLTLLLALLPLLKLRLGLVALSLAALALYRLRPPRRAVTLLAGGIMIAFGAILLHNQWRFGNALKIHRWDELNPYSSSLADFARGAFGMFYDGAFGLFPNAPIWLLLVPACWLLVRRKASLLGDLAVVTLPYLAALAPRFEWYGGWSPPFRYPLVFLPLFALLLLPLIRERRRPGLAALLAGLGALTLVLAAVWVVVPGWTYNFADGRTHLLDEAGVRLGADVARFFPSTVRPRLATWIWPPLSLLLVPLALGRWPPRRGRWRHSAMALGFAGVLALAAIVPLLARHWPTRVIEPEDAWVKKDRGVAFPETWVLQRPRYRSGWVIPPRGRLEARVAPGGEAARLRLFVRAVHPSQRARLSVAAGADVLAEKDVAADGWQTLELGPFAWPAGEPLVLAGGGARFPGRVAVDRVEWKWE